MKRDGVSILKNIFNADDVKSAKLKLNNIYLKQQIEANKNNFNLEEIYDENVVRSPFVYDDFFLEFIFHDKILIKLKKLLGETFVLMLQNAPLNRIENAH